MHGRGADMVNHGRIDDRYRSEHFDVAHAERREEVI
jgi:hypothetical protein